MVIGCQTRWLGVALLIALLGSSHTPLERLAAYDRAWWSMAAMALASLAPLALLLKRRAPIAAAPH